METSSRFNGASTRADHSRRCGSRSASLTEKVLNRSRRTTLTSADERVENKCADCGAQKTARAPDCVTACWIASGRSDGRTGTVTNPNIRQARSTTNHSKQLMEHSATRSPAPRCSVWARCEPMVRTIVSSSPYDFHENPEGGDPRKPRQGRLL